MENIIIQVKDFLTMLVIPFFIIFGLYFTVKLRGVQFTKIGEMFRVILKKNDDKDSVSSFQAFTMALAARVGVGSIAGVAIALVDGGVGAIFWMWIVALIGGATAFTESTLSQIFKEKNQDGHTFRGGPSYYIKSGLGKYKLGLLYAILIIITYTLGFTAVQTNTIAGAFKEAFNIDPIISGLVVSLLVAIITFGGIKSIAKSTEAIVPFMAGAYLIVTGFILVVHFKEIPQIFQMIITEAFNIKSMGLAAFLSMLTIGFNRGIFTNEAGLGSGAIASATAKVDHPIEQGLIQALGVYITTILICTMTALVVILSGAYINSSVSGIEVTQRALSMFIGDFGSIFIAISVFFFAFSTIISGYYYGESSIQFIKDNKMLINILRVFVLIIIVISSIMQSSLIWTIVDILVVAIAILNIIVIYELSQYVVAALKDYKKQQKEGYTPKYKNIRFNVWK